MKKEKRKRQLAQSDNSKIRKEKKTLSRKGQKRGEGPRLTNFAAEKQMPGRRDCLSLLKRQPEDNVTRKNLCRGKKKERNTIGTTEKKGRRIGKIEESIPLGVWGTQRGRNVPGGLINSPGGLGGKGEKPVNDGARERAGH